jgi:hypothetical protein
VQPDKRKIANEDPADKLAEHRRLIYPLEKLAAELSYQKYQCDTGKHERIQPVMRIRLARAFGGKDRLICEKHDDGHGRKFKGAFYCWSRMHDERGFLLAFAAGVILEVWF